MGRPGVAWAQHTEHTRGLYRQSPKGRALSGIYRGLRIFLSNLAILACLAVALGACGGDGNKADERKVVGVLQLIDVPEPVVTGLKEGLAELDFVEGQDIEYLFRNIKGDTSLLEGYLKEMVDSDVDDIVSISDRPTMAAKRVAQQSGTPVIFTVVSNPLAARPRII